MPAEVLAIFDRLRQPDNLSPAARRASKLSRHLAETHGFASLPRGRFAIIVRGSSFERSMSCRLPQEAPAAVRIKHYLEMFVNDFLEKFSTVLFGMKSRPSSS
jgi:hypothetical protein